MIFNSLDFAIFLPIVFILYWFVANQNIRLQNLLIVIASYIFYGWWSWKFLLLIVFSTLVDYSVGLGLAYQESKLWRKTLLCVSIFANLGLLGFFKYYNFFLENLTTAFSFFGSEIGIRPLNIILPVGISFYTFQTLSYTIDTYRRKIKPTKDFIAFSAFVSFFPQLVAGPIERAEHLLPQFYLKRSFEYDRAFEGISLILWGLFKKIVIADNCSEYVNLIFDNSNFYSGSTLILGSMLFAFQIYGDFSGYSDIAIGTSRLFGFDLMRNFAFPYFSRDIAEFWRRWHISLSNWFRDYLYIPLGGSRSKTLITVRNVFIIFIVSGFWHGANWTFIIWGTLNALYFMPLLLAKNNRNNLDIVAQDRFFPKISELLSMGFTFCSVMISWIFFRAENLSHAISYLRGIISPSLFSVPQVRPLETISLILVFLIIEWYGRKGQYAVSWINNIKLKSVRYSILYMIAMSIILFMSNNEQEFIYFQF